MTHSTPRHGYTTGACAAAAAKGAALMLIRQEVVNEVTIHLPAGLSATFELHGQRFDADAAACFVVKDAGDDPDVTNGAEVHARTTLVPFDSLPFGSARRTECGLSGVEARAGIIISGGIGIGRATKPGLAVAPGEWAINPVPRRMIEEAVRVVSPHNGMRVEISIPDGAERAKKTLNARLGIVGGLSILGTSGIVRPLSAAAWTDTIDTALDVARACGCATVVLSTGRTSEMAAQNWLKSSPPQSPLVRGEAKAPPLTRGGGGGVTLPEEAYIMMGDHVAHSLRACTKRGFLRPVIACQFAKLLKIACGYGNTHAVASELDLSQLRQWVAEAALPSPLPTLINRAHTAREIALESGFDQALLAMVCRRAKAAAQAHAPAVTAEFLVADYNGTVVYHGSYAPI